MDYNSIQKLAVNNLEQKCSHLDKVKNRTVKPASTIKFLVKRNPN